MTTQKPKKDIEDPKTFANWAYCAGLLEEPPSLTSTAMKLKKEGHNIGGHYGN